MREIHRARDRSLGRIVPFSVQPSHPSKRKRKQVPQNRLVRYRVEPEWGREWSRYEGISTPEKPSIRLPSITQRPAWTARPGTRRRPTNRCRLVANTDHRRWLTKGFQRDPRSRTNNRNILWLSLSDSSDQDDGFTKRRTSGHAYLDDRNERHFRESRRSWGDVEIVADLSPQRSEREVKTDNCDLVFHPSQPRSRLTLSRLHEWERNSVDCDDQDLKAEIPNELRLMDLENALRMVDHRALARDMINFNTQRGIQWINDAFQTRIEEMEAEVETMVNPGQRGSPAGRVSSHVPLTTEANVVQPTTSSDMRERLGTTPASRGRSLESRRGGGPPQVATQPTTSTANQPKKVPSAQKNSQADPAAIIDTSKTSELLWNRPDPSPSGRYKADMAIKLNMSRWHLMWMRRKGTMGTILWYLEGNEKQA